MNSRLIDWIWHVRGSLPLTPGQTSDDVFDRLNPLFVQTGTSHLRTNGTLTFSKKDQAAQDKMSVFDGGVLHVEKGAEGSVLRYDLTSRALLFCFLAPLLFLGFAQITTVVVKMQKSSTEAVKKADKSSDASKKEEAKNPPKLNPIDKFLGAPEPEKPKKDDKDKPKGRDKKPSPTPAYVFAGIFAALYVIGRLLESRLIKNLFERRLRGS